MLTGQQEFKVATRFDFIYLYDAKPLLWYFDLPGEVTWASVVVWGISGFTVWGDGILGSGVVVLTGGLVVRGAGLATVLVITMGTLVVRTGGLGVVRIWGLGVVLAGAGGWGGGVVAGTCGCTGAAVVGTAGEVQKQKRMSESKNMSWWKYSIRYCATVHLLFGELHTRYTCPHIPGQHHVVWTDAGIFGGISPNLRSCQTHILTCGYLAPVSTCSGKEDDIWI